jgi:hypothetical protein
MRPNKDFKLSKSAKRVLATMTPDKRNLWKKSYIEAEMAAKLAKFAKIRETKGEEA